MNIDIFTLLVQIVNFLVLIVILNKLIYKPLIGLMKNRREYIKSSIDNAENKLKEAEKIREEYTNELKKIENYKEEQIKKIDDQIFEYKTSEILKIKEELEIKKAEFEKRLESEKNSITRDLIKRFCFNTNDFLKNIFLSLSNNQLNSAILNKFINEIMNLSSENIDRINKSTTKIIDFYSSFELNQDEKNNVKNTFSKCGILFNDINFIIDANMILGNKISAGGLVINSNIQNIIDQFSLDLKKNM